MSRREYNMNPSTPTIDPIFNAPLTNNLQDVVSGTVGIIKRGSQGTFTQDGMLFKSCVLEFDNNWIKNVKYDTPFTILFSYKKTSQSGHATLMSTWVKTSNPVGILIECNNSTPTNLTCSFTKSGYVRMSAVGYANSGVINVQHHKSGFSYDGNGTLTRIQDGIITANTNVITQSNFQNFAQTTLCFGGSISYNGDHWAGTIGNILIFDKELTQEEINKL